MRTTPFISTLTLATALLSFPPLPATAQVFNADTLNGLTWRNLGPFRAGAWAIGVAVPESPAKAHRDVVYAALRTGGVWKSSNAGVTFEPVFDGQNIYSMGAVAVR